MEHDEYDRIEQAINEALAVTLSPRSPAVLYDVIEGLSLGRGATAIDVGCGEGHHTIELARRSGMTVLGIDPLERRLDVGRQAISSLSPATAARVRFRRGTAEDLPAEDTSIDLVLYREMLYLVADPVLVFEECRRVLTPGGRAVVYQLFNAEGLEPREASRFWGSDERARRADAEYLEACAARARLAVSDVIDLRSETVEWAEEQNGTAGRELLAAARLLRDPDRYIERFGRAAYDIKLNDALWFVYRMIGKLTQRIYVLRSA